MQMEVKVNRWNGESWENCCECDICGRLASVINLWKDSWFCANCLKDALREINEKLLVAHWLEMGCKQSKY